MSHQSELIHSDISAYLEQHEKKELLRLLTCGSVDDGKSTLIGRLLHDSKMIYEDQLAAITADSVKSGTTGKEIDLALLVDGLQAEREQGITIDVAYRYFSTAKRKFIIADTPGHEQYTRNMATGASTCDLAIILIDARYGVQIQTRRHTIISSLLGIKHIIVAINKMDLVDYAEDIYNNIKKDYLNFTTKLNHVDIKFIPISALKGDNVVNQSIEMPWYKAQPLMQILETIEIYNDRNFKDMRFPVQYVNRPDHNFRGYCGTMASGVIRKNDKVTVLPSGKTSTIKSIVTFEGEIEHAFPPMAITLTLNDEIDVSRGDMITHRDHQPCLGNNLDKGFFDPYLRLSNLTIELDSVSVFEPVKVPGDTFVSFGDFCVDAADAPEKPTYLWQPTKLPSLPPSLQKLALRGLDKLTKLPDLPAGLEELTLIGLKELISLRLIRMCLVWTSVTMRINRNP